MTADPPEEPKREYALIGDRWDTADLPILKSQELLKDTLRVPCLLETKEFIKFFNAAAEKNKLPSWKISQRSLQFYSSPSLRVMPKPILRGGHKGHYEVPEHFMRLRTIQNLKQTYFLPLWLIREVLHETPEPIWHNLIHLALPANELLEMLPHTKKLGDLDLMQYQACKLLAQRAFLSRAGGPPANMEDTFDAFQARVINATSALTDWVKSAAGRRTFSQIEQENEDPEVQRLTKKIESYKRKLLRQR
jgi:hypothetical protein